MIDRAMAANLALTAAIVTMQPVGRVGQPRDIAAVVVFLCSDGASFRRAARSSSCPDVAEGSRCWPRGLRSDLVAWIGLLPRRLTDRCVDSLAHTLSLLLA